MSDKKKQLEGNRFLRAQHNPNRLDVGSQRSIERFDTSKYRSGSVYLPNPFSDPSFDRGRVQEYEQRIYGLGLNPNNTEHFWQLIQGDVGAGSSIYRVAEIFQNLGNLGSRTAETVYSKSIELATMRSTDNRPRHFQVSLFSVGRVFRSSAPSLPLSLDEIERFSSGIRAGTVSIAGNTQFGIPLIGTSQFRIMASDESGQRFVDVDTIGTRSLNFYGFGVTVFALIKEDGYEIDRRRTDSPPLGPGILDQSILGARIIPIRGSDSKTTNNRTVSIINPAGPAEATIVPIPPGSKKVQIYTTSAGADTVTIFFATVDPLDSTAAIDGNQGIINFSAGSFSTDIYDIPNSNSISILNPDRSPSRIWTFVFEVTS